MACDRSSKASMLLGFDRRTCCVVFLAAKLNGRLPLCCSEQVLNVDFGGEVQAVR